MKNLIKLAIITSILTMLSSCSNSRNQKPRISQNGNVISENVISENFLYEDIKFEDYKIEEQLFEIYLFEKKLVETTIKNQLLKESIIKEVILIETFYIPSNNPYKYYDGAAGQALFGDLDVDSLIRKGAAAAGIILTIAVISVVPYVNPISVAIITVAKNALPYVIKGAKVGTLLGAGIGATFGVTDALDSSNRISALTSLALSTAFLILTILNPPLAGTAFAAWGAITAITASSAGLVFSGINAYKVFERTDKIDIDLENLDWDEIGYSVASKSIDGAANGVLIGAFSGAFLGAGQSFYKVNGKVVLIDKSTFDPFYVDSVGRSNIDRMKAGLAPIGRDGYTVNLHHLDQTNDGAIVEMQQSIHISKRKIIHKNTGQYPSDIDRPGFNTYREEFWKWRASNLW